jgi:hypothetical protein
LSKSGCSSTSETSKGSGLSLSRSDARVSRVKARERARERTAKEKEELGFLLQQLFNFMIFKIDLVMINQVKLLNG